MEAAGMTNEEKIGMIGNCAPRLLVYQAFQAISSILMPYCQKWTASTGECSDPGTELASSRLPYEQASRSHEELRQRLNRLNAGGSTGRCDF